MHRAGVPPDGLATVLVGVTVRALWTRAQSKVELTLSPPVTLPPLQSLLVNVSSPCKGRGRGLGARLRVARAGALSLNLDSRVRICTRNGMDRKGRTGGERRGTGLDGNAMESGRIEHAVTARPKGEAPKTVFGACVPGKICYPDGVYNAVVRISGVCVGCKGRLRGHIPFGPVLRACGNSRRALHASRACGRP